MSTLRRIRPLSVGLLTLVLLAGCSRRDEAVARPNVLVLLIDALRADHLSVYGYDRQTSPNLDRLALESVVFLRAYAQSPWTKPSVPTIFTSLYPIQHRVYEGERMGRAGHLESDVLGQDCVTLAESLTDAGYRTGAFVNNAHLEEGQGVAQGFGVYHQGNQTAPEIHELFFEFLGAGDERPFFAYLHYLDVHWPFRPQPPYDEKFPVEGATLPLEAKRDWRGLRDRINDGLIELSNADREKMIARHDGGIAELDHQIGVLIEELRGRGLLENTVILLTSDHGEELFDHGRVGHGGTLFEEVVRVPFLIRLPGGRRAGTEERAARLLDVFPTLASLAGGSLPPHVEGVDLLNPSPGPVEIVAETRHKSVYKVSFREGDWKYIRVYRGARGHVRAGEEGVRGIVSGMRIKVKGEFRDDRFEAEKVTLKDPSDDDVELTGPIERLELEAGRLVVLGRSIELAETMRPGEVLANLETGDWVKVEGEIDRDRRFKADQIEVVDEESPRLEIEAIVTHVERISGSFSEISVGSLPVLITDETRLKGFDGPRSDREVLLSTDGNGQEDPDPFSPERLSSGSDLMVEESLFDLATDPGETRDRKEEEPVRMDRFRARLRAWLERVRGTRHTDVENPKPLSEETIERLKTLGYLR